MSKRRFFKITVFLAALVAGWALTAPFLAKILIVEKPVERADAIFVLAGSATYLERTRKAAALYKSGIAPRVLLTDDGGRAGWSHAERRNTPFVELARRNLIAQGVAAGDIEILQPQVDGTIEEARLLREKIARESGWKTILLVTSSYHTRRALRVFERTFAGAANRANEEVSGGGSASIADVEIGIIGVPPGEQTPLPSVWWLSPLGWNMVAGEYLKSIYYWTFS